jgi:phosphatidate cytidylyltransferase
MSWRAALADPIFRRYVAIVVGLLAVSGAALSAITWGLRRDVTKVWTIWRSWLVMAPLGLVVLALGREAVIVGVTLLAVFAFKEFARATGLYRDWWTTGSVYAALLAAAAASAAWAPGPTADQRRAGAWAVLQATPLYGTLLVLLVPVARNRVQGQLQSVSLAVLGLVFVGWTLMHLAFLANTARAYGYLAFVVFAVEVCDISAYFFGKLLGRRPLRSAVSPKKTWGGSLGALAVALALPWVLGFSFPPCFDWRAKVLAGLIVGVGGQLGDLSVSVFKRDLGIKDMGAAIPGHGGLLDRVDSLLVVAPLFTHLVNWVEPFGR